MPSQNAQQPHRQGRYNPIARPAPPQNAAQPLVPRPSAAYTAWEITNASSSVVLTVKYLGRSSYTWTFQFESPPLRDLVDPATTPLIVNPVLLARIFTLRPRRAAGSGNPVNDRRFEDSLPIEDRSNFALASRGDALLYEMINKEMLKHERAAEDAGINLEYSGQLHDVVKRKAAKNATLAEIARECGFDQLVNLPNPDEHDLGSVVEAVIWATARQCSEDQFDCVAMVQLDRWLGNMIRGKIIEGQEELAPDAEQLPRAKSLDTVKQLILTTTATGMTDRENAARGAAAWLQSEFQAQGISMRFTVREFGTAVGDVFECSVFVGNVWTASGVSGRDIAIGIDLAALKVVENRQWTQRMNQDLHVVVV